MLVTQDLCCVVTRVLYITLEINVMFTGKKKKIGICYVKGIITRFLFSVQYLFVHGTRNRNFVFL